MQEWELLTKNNLYSDNNGDIPNVMTSPAIFPIGGSSDTDLKDIGTVNQNWKIQSIISDILFLSSKDQPKFQNEKKNAMLVY